MNATIDQFATLNITLTRALSAVIERLPDIGETIRLAEANEATLADGLLSTLLSLTGEKQEPQPEAAPVPKASVLTVEVVAEFTLGGQNFEAVRVKWTGERPTREAAIRAADTDGRPVVRTDKEWGHVYEHRRELPDSLNGFWLLTARPDPDVPRYVSGLLRDSGEWCYGWYGLDDELSGGGLVLRRRT